MCISAKECASLLLTATAIKYRQGATDLRFIGCVRVNHSGMTI